MIEDLVIDDTPKFPRIQTMHSEKQFKEHFPQEPSPPPRVSQSTPPMMNGKKKKGLFGFLKKKKLKKPNKVGVIYLRNNGNMETMVLDAQKGFFSINGKTYHENKDCIYSYIDESSKDRVPVAIIPEWSLIPVGTKRFDDQTMLEKFAELQDHVLKGIRYAELVKMGDTSDKKIDIKQAILIAIGALVAGAVLMNYI